MAMRTSSYGEVRDRVLPGDVIAFLGNNPLSQAIEVAGTAGVSHVGIILEAGTPAQEPRFVEASVHFDADELALASGVLVSSFRVSVDDYGGAAWWLPLDAGARAAFDQGKFAEFIAGALGDRFDFLGGLAVVVGGLEKKIEQEIEEKVLKADVIPELQPELHLHVKKAYCCSALVANALQAAGVVSVDDPFAIDPSRVCSWRVYAADYHRLKDTDEGGARIHGYNSVAL